MKRRLLLLARGPHREFAAKTLLRRPDISLVVADGPNTNSPRVWADEQIPVPWQEEDLLLERIMAAAQREPIDGVMTFADVVVPLTARVAAMLGVPGLSVRAAETCTNKLNMRGVLSAAGVPCPKFFKVASLAEAQAAVREVGLPAIVKPTDGSASFGVVKVANSAEVTWAFHVAFANSKSGVLLVEEFLDGPEISVEVLVVGRKVHVVTLTDKTTTAGPYFTEIGHSVPSTLPPITQSEVHKLIAQVALALDLTNCAAHVEVKLTPAGLRIVEVGGRLGGDCISNLVYLALGVNLVDAAADIALGLEPDLTPKFQRGAAIAFATAPSNATLLRKPVLSRELMRAPDVAEVIVDYAPGDQMRNTGTDIVRPAAVITTASSPEHARARAEYLVTTIHLPLQP